MTLSELNLMPREDAVATFVQCCAAPSWAEAMTDGRPYASANELYSSATALWDNLGPPAWRDAFQGHPRIGETKSASGQSKREQSWSAGEQSAALQSESSVRAELAELQADYEARFGHIFLICATGKSAPEIRDAVRARLSNDATTELRVAAREQALITRLRLEKLLDS